MSVVALGKVTLVGLSGERERVLSDLQAMGSLHLIPLTDPHDPSGQGPSTPPASAAEGPSSRAREALAFLLGCPRRLRQSSLAEEFDPAGVEDRALEIKNRLLDLEDEKDGLVERIEALAPFGDFEFPAPEDVAGMRLWLYVVPDAQVDGFATSRLAWAEVGKENNSTYLAVLSESEPQGLPVAPVETGGNESGRELERRLEKAEMEIEDLRAERASLSRWLTLYVGNLHRLEDGAALEHAKTLCRAGELLFAVQGWVAAADVETLETYAASKGLALTVEDPGPDDAPPITLSNPRRLSFGEQLLAFYQLPGYRDWDPSAIVFLSFALFFAMILADAAYGAMLGVVLLLLWKRLGKTEADRGFRNLMTAIVAASVVFGVLLGSYLGVSPPPGSLLDRLKVMDINDFDSMMMLSVVIGGAHVILANLMTAWHRRQNVAALAPLGWVTITIGGLVAYVAGLESDAARVGLGAVVAGAVAVLLFTGTRRVHGVGDLVVRFFQGLQGLAGFSGLFGDVLSYLRLFALGLASGSLAVTFNGLAAQVADAGNRHGIAIFGAFLILIVGHALNLTLGVVSGVVHGLRLNVIEFYKWSVFEEGRPFRAFRKKENVTWTH